MAKTKLTVPELIQGIQTNSTVDVDVKTVRAVLDALRTTTAEKLKEGFAVNVWNIATVEVVTAKARRGINPQTKKPIEIPEREKVKAKAAKPFNREVVGE